VKLEGICGLPRSNVNSEAQPVPARILHNVESAQIWTLHHKLALIHAFGPLSNNILTIHLLEENKKKNIFGLK